METPTFSRIILIALLLITGSQSFAQNFVDFLPVFNEDLNGDILLIGNNTLGPLTNNNDEAIDPDDGYYEDTGGNAFRDLGYIDIDNDSSTFSSSSAQLVIPNSNCYVIRYAALYWGAVERDSDETNFNTVKFKIAGEPYVDVTGTVIYDRTTSGGTEVAESLPYACFADVTDIVNGFPTNLGMYTVANVVSREGQNGGTGQSSGWSLFVVYEDSTLPGKSITSFNGFSVTSGNPPIDGTTLISGFRTVPAPTPVRANFAFAALEGDKPISGDQLLINGSPISALDRPVNNFFNSTVTALDALPVTNRVPNSTNTTGFDTGILAIPNPGNSVIANDATSAVVDLTSIGDAYFPYFFAIAIETDMEIPIMASCVPPFEAQLDANGNLSILPSDIYLGNVDSCNVESVVLNVSNFDCSDLGPNEVVLTITDIGGNSATCTTTITVLPFVGCSEEITVMTDSNICEASNVDLIFPQTLDACVEVNSITNNAPEVFPIGTTAVTWTIVFEGGQEILCEQLVTVVDLQGPVVSCISSESVVIDEGDTFVVPNYFLEGLVTALDNCSNSIDQVSQDPIPGTLISDAGIYPIVISIEDEFGNESICEFDLTVDFTLDGISTTELYKAIQIYPNPTSKSIRIGSSEGLRVDCVSIFSINGRLLEKHETGNIPKREFDISSFPAGAYIILIETEEGEIAKPFVKK